MKQALLSLIRLYQVLISPMLGVACRYEPSCSHYAIEAIELHGARRGLWFAVRRLSRCRPGGGSGYDPVPDPTPARDVPLASYAAHEVHEVSGR